MQTCVEHGSHLAITPAAPRDAVPQSAELSPALLRQHVEAISARRAHEAWACTRGYINLLVVSPTEAFFAWRLQPAWVSETEARYSQSWSGSRLVIRLYDVSYILFNGLNAHKMRDVNVDGLTGERPVSMPLGGTFQLAEIGFVLRTGEFVAAARSLTAHFPSAAVSSQEGAQALYVDDRLAPEPVRSPWESKAYLEERHKPRLRSLTVGLLSFESFWSGQRTPGAVLVTSLARGLCALGFAPHLFVPAAGDLTGDRVIDGVHCHALQLEPGEGPISLAIAFARALDARLSCLPRCDLFHLQEWMTTLVPWLGTVPAVLGLTSLEAARRNDSPVSELSQKIEKLEREAAASVECVLVPGPLRDQAVGGLGLNAAHVHALAGEEPADYEWDGPLDLGLVKQEVDCDPQSRLLLFIGPLEHGAGPDLLVEAMPALLAREPALRAVFVGVGPMQGALAGRVSQLGLDHAFRLLGHVDGGKLARIVRASLALVLPSRRRIAYDEDLIRLARRAGRPVLTTHRGAAHLVEHERTGLLLYDHLGSIAWGLNRLLDDLGHAEKMGRAGGAGFEERCRRLAQRYADLCARAFPELTVRAGAAASVAREKREPVA